MGKIESDLSTKRKIEEILSEKEKIRFQLRKNFTKVTKKRVLEVSPSKKPTEYHLSPVRLEESSNSISLNSETNDILSSSIIKETLN